jgi:hypothetical protein
MNLLLLLVLTNPVGCLGVLALAGALRMVGAIKSGLGLGSADGNPLIRSITLRAPLPQSTDQPPVSGPDGMLV